MHVCVLYYQFSDEVVSYLRQYFDLISLIVLSIYLIQYQHNSQYMLYK
nr:MAG TPA: hypothetical protein [Caudoviricetes sp.]